jgi:hypothetical protein
VLVKLGVPQYGHRLPFVPQCKGAST